MTQMLKHKVTGELFIYTSALAKLEELEPVVEDRVANVVEEVIAAQKKEPDPVVAADVNPGAAQKSTGVDIPTFIKPTKKPAKPKG